MRRAAKRREAALSGAIEFFIERHHAGIAAIIRRRLGKQYNHKQHGTPEEQRLWCLNDPELYAWAIREGVREDG